MSPENMPSPEELNPDQAPQSADSNTADSPPEAPSNPENTDGNKKPKPPKPPTNDPLMDNLQKIHDNMSEFFGTAQLNEKTGDAVKEKVLGLMGKIGDFLNKHKDNSDSLDPNDKEEAHDLLDQTTDTVKEATKTASLDLSPPNSSQSPTITPMSPGNMPQPNNNQPDSTPKPSPSNDDNSPQQTPKI